MAISCYFCKIVGCESGRTGTARKSSSFYINMNLILKRTIAVCLLCLLYCLPAMANEAESLIAAAKKRQWVDSVFKSMTPQQRIGQLFMVAAYSNLDQAHVTEIERLVRLHNIGGLMFMQGGPVRQAKLTNRYQSIAKVPLLIAMDAEWGLNMRLDSSMRFPRQMTLGAIGDPRYTYLMGREIALKLKRMGVHVSFSPVIDVNSNPMNPVIGTRSFGENKEHVAERGLAYMEGLQDHGILAVAKHFPGHGDTDSDSHYTLPVLNYGYDRLNDIELYPFRKAFGAGVMGVMVAHMQMPHFDTTRNLASSLSPAIVTGLLQKQMGYKGLIFTDALNMKGVANYYAPGEVDLKALLAGNDVLLFPEDVAKAVEQIHFAVENCLITQEEIDRRVKKILSTKFWAGLNNYQPVNLTNLQQEVDRPMSNAVQQQLFEKAMTVVANEKKLLPFRMIDTTTFASLSIGRELGNTFQKTLGNYAAFNHFALPYKYEADSVFLQMFHHLKSYGTVVVGIHDIQSKPHNNYAISAGTLRLIDTLQKVTNVVIVTFGNPYSLRLFENSKWILSAYEDNESTQLIAPQVLFGALEAKGKLPVTASQKFKSGTGIATQSLGRLRYTVPEAVGLSSAVLAQIDNIATEAIAYAATPGAQVLVAKDGAVVFNKSYGHFTYDKSRPVTNTSIYDIASVTKVVSTLQAIMFLKDQGKLDLDQKISVYLPELKGSNKQNLVLRDVLAHQAGLAPFIPHWQKTVDKKGLSSLFYASIENELFCNPVAPGIFSIKSMEDSVWKWTVESKLIAKNAAGKYDYKYSDLGFYILKRIAEKQLNQPIDEFLDQHFYGPLGMNYTTYRPLNRFDETCIAPTEQDNYWRKAIVCGTVHDQGAAMFGGVAGHAGLFSNSNDLAKILQMNLNNGKYGGHDYFKKKVVTEFSKKQFKNSRRGLGWDKPEPAGNGPTSDLASPLTFGHTGFTGTGVWIDPETRLIYIFLSNRTYPDAENTKLVKYNIRTRIHDVVYKALLPKT